MLHSNDISDLVSVALHSEVGGVVKHDSAEGLSCIEGDVEVSVFVQTLGCVEPLSVIILGEVKYNFVFVFDGIAIVYDV